LAASVAGLILVVGWRLDGSGIRSTVASVVAFSMTALTAGYFWWIQWSSPRVAATVQRRAAIADNVVVTAEEVASGRQRRPHPLVEAALFQAAVAHLDRTPPDVVQPLARSLVLAGTAVVAVIAVGLATSGAAIDVTRTESDERMALAPRLQRGELRVLVTPPAYARQSATDVLNPTSLVVLEGSRLRLETARTGGEVSLLRGSGERMAFIADGTTTWLELIATITEPLIVQMGDGATATDRFLNLRVQPDNRPTVRISRPARDLMMPEPKGQVSIDVDAEDDLELASLALRYTKMSGSGETFTFEEGEWPLQIARRTPSEWKAHASIALEALKLEDGETLVYRAVARDGKPGADPATSDTFLIAIGRLAGVASTGFALPEDRDRQGLSQQMLIIKTERLHAESSKLTNEALVEQSRLLAVEQRMIKAEFVFMTGGEVADEVEEATHAHELVEGRLENTAQVELLTAIREMSRAEARLNDGDVVRALVFERAALGALQRAFDRRRYLLRTLPERTRIDPSRRLTGDLTTARTSDSSSAIAPADPVISRARELLLELSTPEAKRADPTRLAARIIAIDSSSEELHKAAVQLASSGESTRDESLREAATALLATIQARLASGSERSLSSDPLAGRLAEELRGLKGGPR
jgi:hypothetical protein